MPGATAAAAAAVDGDALFIGVDQPDQGGMFPFNGWIQDVAFWGAALSIETIKQHFSDGINP